MTFDLTSLIGLPVHQPDLHKLMLLCEERPIRGTPELVLAGRYDLAFPRSVFSVLIAGTGIVDTIHVYTFARDGYEKFFTALPFDLVVVTTQKEARDLFGPPTISGGPVTPSPAHPFAVYWDRWDYSHHTFHLEYPESRNAIQLITIVTPPADH